MELSLRQRTVLQQDQITGFSLSFSKALLFKLYLMCMKRDFLNHESELWIFVDNHSSGEKKIDKITPFGKNIIHYLKQQFPYTEWDNLDPMYEGFDKNEIFSTLKDAQKVIKIFEPQFDLLNEYNKYQKKHKN